MLAKISTAKNKITIASEDLPANQNFWQVATGAGHDVQWITVSGGTGPIALRLVDSANVSAGYSRSDGILLNAEASNSYSPFIEGGIPMNKGIAVVFEQGIGGNVEVSLGFN